MMWHFIFRPEQHGTDMLGPLSDLLNSCGGEQGAPAAALALEGLYYLCEAEVNSYVYPTDTWQNEWRNDVILMSMRHHHFTWASIQRHSDTMCLLNHTPENNWSAKMDSKPLFFFQNLMDAWMSWMQPIYAIEIDNYITMDALNIKTL